MILLDSWEDVVRVIIIAPTAYIALLVLLRTSGKRTLSKMNAFDFVVTVALGSVLATVIMSENVSLAEGVSAFAMLILLQFIITWLSVRFHFISNIVKSEPTLLFHKGQYLSEAMKQQRVVHDEIMAAMREEGIGKIEEVEAVILESDGTFSVLPRV